MRWYGYFGPTARDAWPAVPLETGTVGPIEIGKPIYGFVIGRDAAPYWANRIQGTLPADQWTVAETLEAATQARTVAALLSLIHRVGVRLVDRPWPDARRARARFRTRRQDSAATARSGAPAGVQGAWARLETEEATRQKLLKGALIMFHEGLLLRMDHPSLALVAFVAAVEAVGQIEAPPDPPCPTCGFKKGAHRAYKSALTRAGFTGELLRTADSVYSKFRSPTVHAATLHGHESTSNVQVVKLGAHPPHRDAAAFVFPVATAGAGQLWLLEEACRRALSSYLL